MTTIDRLGLQGIRSYGTDEETYIKFYKPLTIILGRNGSGKSTIIEAVKMATTGDLPPIVDKGAAFIRDPRISNETETKAKIRLQFTNARGDQYVISRHFQLTIKRAPRGIGLKTEFKTMDQTLKKTSRDGDSSSSSYRCNDLNSLLPEVMRVSKPILNNVIFVHQEESLWPLGDAKKLKEKFDEIFAATRYTKALETIRKFRKDQATELRIIGSELVHFEDKVQTLEAIRNDCAAVKADARSMEAGLAELEKEIEALDKKRDAACELAKIYTGKMDNMNKLMIENKEGEKERARMFSEMEILVADMDDDILQMEIKQLQEYLELSSSERQQRKNLIEELQREIDMKNDAIGERKSSKGAYEQRQKEQKRRLRDQQTMKVSLCSQNLFGQNRAGDEVEHVAGPDPDADAREWSLALARLMRESEERVRCVTTSGNSAQDLASKSKTELEVRLESKRIEASRNSELLEQEKQRIIKLRQELRELADVRDREKEAACAEQAAQIKLKEKIDGADLKTKEEHIRSLRLQDNVHYNKLKDLRGVRDDLRQDQKARSRLDVCRDLVSKKTRELESVLEDFTDKLVTALTDLEDIDPDGDSEGQAVDKASLRETDLSSEQGRAHQRRILADACRYVLRRRDNIFQSAEGLFKQRQAEVSDAAARQNELTMQVRRSETKLAESELALRIAQSRLPQDTPDVVEVDDLAGMFQSARIVQNQQGLGMNEDQVQLVSKAVSDLESSATKCARAFSHAESRAAFAAEDLTEFEKHDKKMCPACGLTSSKKVESMRESLTKRRDYYTDPSSLQEQERTKTHLESAVVAFKRVYSAGSQAATDLAALDVAEVRAKEAEMNEKTRRRQAGAAKEAFESLQGRVGSGTVFQEVEQERLELSRVVSELEKVRREVEKAQGDLSAGTGADRSMADVDSEIAHLEKLGREISCEIENNLRLLDQDREGIQRARTRCGIATRQRLQLAADAERYDRMDLECKKRTSNVRVIESEIEEARHAIKGITANLDYAESEFTKVRSEHASRIDDANRALSKVQLVNAAWKDLANKIEEYKCAGTESALETVKTSLAAMEKEIASKTEDLRAFENEESQASDSQKNAQSKIRNLEDNQRYRGKERAIHVNSRGIRQLKSEINQLKRQAGNVDPQQRVEELAEEYNRRNGVRYATLGKLQILKENFKSKKKELGEAEKQGSRRKFDECRIRKQTMELASSDLERYHRALDQALMAFHTLKMGAINRTIKELWQQTYRGTDIDEIEISSDTSDPRAATASGLKRTFNYRVMMRQGQALLDMRGRCSAGQKVLACLVIRLALAESFCTDCGILALDEPTTNLDKENIESLAGALKTIIENRRRQRNFQLVLITHDQEFIDMLGARDFCNEYFMVYKDPQGVSRAKVHELQLLG